MMSKILFLLLVGFSSCAMQTVDSQQVAVNQTAQISESKVKPTVLVELFTSEG